jgi:penicillin-binding protein 1B
MRRILSFYLKHLVVLAAVAFIAYWVWLDKKVIDQFEKRRWDIPARVFAAPTELFQGGQLSASDLKRILADLGYANVEKASSAGQYSVVKNGIELVTRAYSFPDGEESAKSLRLEFSNGAISSLVAGGSNAPLALARLEPVEIGVIHPGVFEDRVLVEIGDVRRLFLERLIAVEDKRFFDHPGVDIWGIFRAISSNLLAGKLRQGGSTITQQLIKNLYLTRERTLRRKFNEALMALSIERRYSKNEILETYLNELYIGQDGNRAIHGFGLGSHFYFGKPLAELNVAEQALLIGLIKGPSAYDPRRHPEQATKRRNIVLEVLKAAELVTESEFVAAKNTPVKLSPGQRPTRLPYSAFMDLVHKRLVTNYDNSALQTRGLRIFTTLDPVAQQKVSSATGRSLKMLAASAKPANGPLQIAAVWADPVTAEVKALIGGRSADHSYNRALLAKRQIGSLIKPFVVAEALSRPERFNLGTKLNDGPISLTDERGEVWTPQNYDHEFHGSVTLMDALIYSYNLASVDVGLKIGVPSVAERVSVMGLGRKVRPYPSLLLGAVEMTPFEVAQLYHTIANEGFHAPLRAIRAVVDSHGEPLRESRTVVKQALDAKVAYLTRFAMREVVNKGTARRLKRSLLNVLPLAGKTGTSDDTRDSWFAGFGSNLIGVVWVGHDNGQSTGLTGSSGALVAWAEMAKAVGIRPLDDGTPEGITKLWVDKDSDSLFAVPCGDSDAIPVIVVPDLPIETCEQSTRGVTIDSARGHTPGENNQEADNPGSGDGGLWDSMKQIFSP